MKTAKEEVNDLLQNIPEDSSLEDIQYHIYVRQKVLKGLDAAEKGDVFSHEEVERRMDGWIKK